MKYIYTYFTATAGGNASNLSRIFVLEADRAAARLVKSWVRPSVDLKRNPAIYRKRA